MPFDVTDMDIRRYDFSKDGLSVLQKHPRGVNWPVVYIINSDNTGGNELYVGETTSAGARFKQHLKNDERTSLDTIRIVFDDHFNKSAILDIEQTLIQMFLADQTYSLQNKNGGQSCKHDYYQRAKYQAKVDIIWNQMKDALKIKQNASKVRNSNLFKYSPYNTLTPEQESVAHEILNKALYCIDNNVTGTSVLSGKAGTGKSIVMIHMMYTLMNAMSVTFNDQDLTPDEQLELGERIALANRIREHDNLKIAFVVPMTSIRKTFKSVFHASKSAGLKASMVIGPQDVLKDEYDIVFVDESHRLARRKGITSFGSFDDACVKLGLDSDVATQLDMIQLKSKYTVLVYDENQTVKASDLTQEQFQRALSLHDNTHTASLQTQMRCMGGQSYINYLDEIFRVAQKSKKNIKDYCFKLWDDPNAMIDKIRELDNEYSLCRVVAGYSWEWKSKGCTSVSEAIKNGLADIELEGKKYVWNRSNQEWIIREDAIEEIGCIHTTQGYDLNYVAVILGHEIDYDNESNSIVIDRSKFYDKKVKSGVSDEELRQYIINSYKVMMSRGIKGCYVYACNKSLQDYLRQFVDNE